MSDTSVMQSVNLRPPMLRVSYDSRGSLTMIESRAMHDRIVCLLAAARIAARAELMRGWAEDPWPNEEPYVPLLAVIDQSVTDAERSPLLRMSYSNPWELVTVISGSALAATVIARRCITIFNDFQDARLKKAFVDRALFILQSSDRDLFQKESPGEAEWNTSRLVRLAAQVDELATLPGVEIESITDDSI